MYAGELALQGCTVRLYDQDSLKLQIVHSIISDQLQQLKDQGLLSQGHQLQVSMTVLLWTISLSCYHLRFVQGSVIVESILASAVSDADIVLEAVVEDVQVKTKLFQGV